MPVAHLNCYVAMMPVLKAEEALRSYQVASCGAGPKNRRQVQQIKRQLREWKKVASRYSERPRAQRAESMEEMKAVLGAMGIRVKEPPRGR